MPPGRPNLAALYRRRIRAEVEQAVARRTAEVVRERDAALRAEQRYARVMDASNAGLYEWDIATGEMYQSPRLKELFAVPSDAQFAGRDDFLDRAPLHPEDRQRIDDVVAAAFAGEVDRYEVDYRILLPQGRTRWIRSYGKVFRDAAGQPQRMAGVVLDVTEHRTAEQALIESEGRFRSLTELLSDWYWRQDENLRFTYLSSQANTLTGYTGESSYGKTRWELVNMRPLSGSWDEHKAVLAARQPFRDLECVRIGTDGLPRYLSMTGAPIFDAEGRFRGYHGIGRNITERKRIEAELRARQDMLDLAQKAAHAAAFEWRIGAIDEHPHWSPDLEAMVGLAPGAYDGTYDTWRKLVVAEDWPAVNAALRGAGDTGDVTVEYRVVHARGEVRWLQAKGRVSFDPRGEPIRMVGFMLDVTERHQAEDDLRRLERQLRQAQRLEAMGTLAGGIAHDFNNILGAILGYGEMALRDAPTGSRLRRDIDSIVTAGERGRALVDRILTFSRSSVNEQVAVHLERVVREALDLLAANLPPAVVLEPQLRAGQAALLGDPTQVHQVVMNLVTNAAQAMPSGGTVRVKLEPVRVDDPCVTTTGTIGAGDYVLLEVADAGAGIAPDIIDRIFDPFFTTKEVGVGTGLGLSLVHGIVTGLGGGINVASVPGAGSVFTVYLPRAADAPGTRAHSETPDVPRGNGERVLVVDDEEPLMVLAIEALDDFGYQPVGFTSSAAALAAFRADPTVFDAVVTDERMPGMTGSALIREMRRLRPGIPTVLMSGFLGGTVTSAARDAGADELLKKPLSRRDLAASLARVLVRYRSTSTLGVKL